MRRTVFAITCLLALGSTVAPGIRAAADSDAELELRFAQTVRPFLTTYCVGCHGGAVPAGQFDLRSYSTVAAVVRDYSHWNALLEKLSGGQMPPKPAKQPPVGKS